jgi:hypothetical protein
MPCFPPRNKLKNNIFYRYSSSWHNRPDREISAPPTTARSQKVQLTGHRQNCRHAERGAVNFLKRFQKVTLTGTEPKEAQLARKREWVVCLPVFATNVIMISPA